MPEPNAPPGTRPYRVKPGTKYLQRTGEGPAVQQVPPGTIVYLTPHQATAWADQFDPVTVVPARATGSAPEPPSDTTSPTTPGALKRWAYAFDDHAGEIEAPSEKEARARIRERYDVPFLPNGTTVTRVP